MNFSASHAVLFCVFSGRFSVDKLERHAVHTVAGVFFGELFASEDVAQVAVAMRAGDFGAASVGVRGVFDGSGQFVVEGGPATAGAEFAT